MGVPKNFEIKINLRAKKILGCKSLESEKIGSTKISNSKIIRVQKIWVPKKILGTKSGPKKMGAYKNLASKKNIRSIMDPNFLCIQKI